MIAVKGLQMPDKCATCPFYNQRENMCLVTRELVMIFNGRPTRCPLMNIEHLRHKKVIAPEMKSLGYSKHFYERYAASQFSQYTVNQNLIQITESFDEETYGKGSSIFEADLYIVNPNKEG